MRSGRLEEDLAANATWDAAKAAGAAEMGRQADWIRQNVPFPALKEEKP